MAGVALEGIVVNGEEGLAVSEYCAPSDEDPFEYCQVDPPKLSVGGGDEHGAQSDRAPVRVRIPPGTERMAAVRVA